MGKHCLLLGLMEEGKDSLWKFQMVTGGVYGRPIEESNLVDWLGPVCYFHNLEKLFHQLTNPESLPVYDDNVNTYIKHMRKSMIFY